MLFRGGDASFRSPWTGFVKNKLDSCWLTYIRKIQNNLVVTDTCWFKDPVKEEHPTSCSSKKGVPHQFSSGWEISSKVPASWENLRNTSIKNS